MISLKVFGVLWGGGVCFVVVLSKTVEENLNCKMKSNSKF